MADSATVKSVVEGRISNLRKRQADSKTGDASWESFDLGLLCAYLEVNAWLTNLDGEDD